MAAMWTSKLGNKFPKTQIEALDSEHHRILKVLRKQPANAVCAECAEADTSWASVNLGIFVCVQCADVHRAVGTHISKVKGCSGTYLWGPDEILRMQQLGNAAVRSQLGPLANDCRPQRHASKEERVRLCTRKYEGFCAETCKQDAPVAVVQTGKAPRPVASSPRAKAASVPVVAKVAPEPSLFDELFKDVEEPCSTQSQPAPPVNAVANLTAPVETRRHPRESSESARASSAPFRSVLPFSTFDDFFADFSAAVPVVEQKVLGEQATPRPLTPDASTTASEDEYAIFDWCLSDTSPSRMAAGKSVPVPFSQATVKPSADVSNLWESFGEW